MHEILFITTMESQVTRVQLQCDFIKSSVTNTVTVLCNLPQEI